MKENTIKVNGTLYEIKECEMDMKLLKWLRDIAGLTGTKCGCNVGQCGSCNVLIDGKAKRSCLFKMAKLIGKEIITIEGLAGGDNLHPVQESFIKCGVMQCGYCTPSQIITAVSLLNENPSPTREDIDKVFQRVYCRCGTYPRVIQAVQRAAAVMRGEKVEDKIETPKSTEIIGSSHQMKDVIDKVTGKLKFTDDYQFDNMLYGKVVFSDYPSAILLDIDATEAEKMPGVVLVLTHKNIKEHYYGPLVKDQPILGKGKIRSMAEPLAVIFAETQEQADAAAPKVNITYKPLKGVFSPQRALEPDAPYIAGEGNICFQTFLQKGDIKKAFNEADIIIEKEYSTQRIEHAYIETESAVVLPNENGTYDVYSTTQAPFSHRDDIAGFLEIDPEAINFHQPPCGGSFGGKGDSLIRLLSSMGAKLTRRPVKITLSRKDSLYYHPKRHPFDMKYAISATKDGKIIGMDVDMIADGGAYTSYSKRVIPQSVCYCTGPYYVPNLRADGKSVYTNNITSGAMRGYGVPQCGYAVESAMDELASALKMDPIELRKKNAIKPGKESASGQILDEGHAYYKTLEVLEEKVQQELIPLKKADPTIGIGIASGWRHIAGGLDPREEAYTTLVLEESGKVTMKIALSEMGNESQTSMRQIVSHETGIHFDTIEVAKMETSNMPWGGAVMASRGTFIWGHSTVKAARMFKDALIKEASKQASLAEDKIIIKEDCFINTESGQTLFNLKKLAKTMFSAGRTIDVTGHNLMPKTYYPPEDCNHSNEIPADRYKTHHTNSYVSVAVALKVDEENKKVKVLKIISVFDIGNVLNPDAALRQAEGGVIMGLGQALSEDFNQIEGKNQVDMFSKYKIIDLAGTPDMENIFIDNYDPAGPLGAKGVGELGNLAVAPAVCNAYYDATGKRVRKLPLLKNL